MSRLLALLDPRNTPIWLKLFLGITLVMLFVLIPATLILRDASDDLSRQINVSGAENLGSSQTTTLTNAINQARTALNAFVEHPENERLLTGLLLRNVNTTDLPLPRTTASEIEALLSTTVLNPATGLFDAVRVVDRYGQVVATQSGNRAAGFFTGSEADQPAFLAAETGAAEGRTQTLTVTPTTEGGAALDYTVALLWRDGRPLGYVMGRVSSSRVLFPGLRFPINLARTLGFSYLAAQSGEMITYADARARAEGVADLRLSTAAFAGNSGVTPVMVGDEAYYVYTTLIPGVPLSLTTYLNGSFADAQLGDVLSARRLAVFIVSGLLGLSGVVLLTGLLASPINRLRRTLRQIAHGDLEVVVPDTRRQDEIGGLARETAALREKYSLVIHNLEDRVVARNRDIAATQEIARYAASQVNLQTLMDRVVDLVIASFPDIYHAQIFLVDTDREFAVLRASTGEAGRQLLRRGHRLGVGSQSVIGQVTGSGELVVARDTAASPVHRRNEFLLDTRAELAVPLRVGTTVIGALDVQSRQPDVFTPDLVSTLELMADQLSITIQNARLYEEVSRRAIEVDDANKRATLDAWQDFMRDQRAQRLSHTAGLRGEDTERFAPLREQALATAAPAIGEPTPRSTLPVVVPIVLRGQALGTVEWEVPAQGFGEDRLSLAQELAGRLAISLENARLFQESRRATERERMVNTISARITAHTNIEQILQTAVREVGQALRAPQVAIRLRDDLAAEPASSPASSPANAPNGSGKPA